MAIYYCRIQSISRSSGRSAVAAAAYRSGERLVDKETGLTKDYLYKAPEVVFSDIILPENAPKSYMDRETLWNEVQKVESRSNSKLAYDIVIALPKECDHDEHIAMSTDYAKSLSEQGMAVDFSIHDKEDGNPHLHVLTTTRGFKENGAWDIKQKKVYKLDTDGNRIPIIDPLTGEQKIGARGRRMWQRETIIDNTFCTPETFEKWKSDWADICNRFLIDKDLDPVDHRSYEKQGLDIEPTIHEGYAARSIEARGGISELCQINREIMERRSQIEIIKDKLVEITAKIKAFIIDKLDILLREGDSVEQRYRNPTENSRFGISAGEDDSVTVREGGDDSTPELPDIEIQTAMESAITGERSITEIDREGANSDWERKITGIERERCQANDIGGRIDAGVCL